MANDIIPQDLLIYRRIFQDSLNKITNEMYAQNLKISYKYDFTLIPKENHPKHFNTSSPIYLLRVFAVDKSKNPVGETYYLYNTFHPKSFDTSVYALERMAIQEWFTTASKALYNFLQETYMNEHNAKQAIKDKIAAQGATEEVVKELKTIKDAEFVKSREQEIIDKFNLNKKPDFGV